jgi:hypothetical protein
VESGFANWQSCGTREVPGYCAAHLPAAPDPPSTAYILTKPIYQPFLHEPDSNLSQSDFSNKVALLIFFYRYKPSIRKFTGIEVFHNIATEVSNFRSKLSTGQITKFNKIDSEELGMLVKIREGRCHYIAICCRGRSCQFLFLPVVVRFLPQFVLEAKIFLQRSLLQLEIPEPKVSGTPK